MTTDTHFLAFLSAMLVFWTAEFTVMAGVRSWMVRAEIINWFGISSERRRVISLLLGQTLTGAFVTSWIGRSMLVWMSGRWHPNLFSIVMLLIGMIGILGMLWWATCAVLGEQCGWKIWVVNLALGLGIGVIAGLYTINIAPF